MKNMVEKVLIDDERSFLIDDNINNIIGFMQIDKMLDKGM